MEKIKRTKVVDLLKSTAYGSIVNVKGWVRTHRSSKAVDFIALNDGSTINNIQIVVDPSKVDENQLRQITTGACISAVGTLVESQGAGQSVEIQCESIEIYGLCGSDYPMQKKGQSFEYMRQYATSVAPYQYLWCRNAYPPQHGDGYPHLLPRAWIFLFQYSAHHSQRLRGCRSDVPGYYQEPLQPEEDRGWQD